MKVVYLTGSGIGNLILATPAFRMIIEAGHDLKIYAGSVPVKATDYIYPYEYVRDPADLIAFKPDYVLQSSYYDHVLPLFTNNPKKISSIYSDLKEKEYVHHLNLAAVLNIPIPDNPIFEARSFLDRIMPDPKTITLTPTGQKTQAVKLWPYFPKLAQELIRKGYTVQVIGLSKDINEEDYPGCHVYIDTHFGVVGDVIRGSSKVVSNDCGLMHYAYALGVKTFVISGPVPTSKTIPPNVHIIEKQKQCKHQPCYAKFFNWNYANEAGICRHECMKNITVNDVLTEIFMEGK